MKRAKLVAAASAVDWAVGDPEWMPHPVRLMGWACARGERLLLRPEHSAGVQLLAGAGLASGLSAGAWLGTRAVLRSVRRVHPWAAAALEVWLAASCLASRNLLDEAGAVEQALAQGDLPEARVRVARIVGRDTAGLDAAGVSRAVIETLAESACDGVVAPLLFLAVGGVPAAMAFKAASTMDSMIGHRTERYEWFGKTAARLDDAANLIPARVTAALLLCAGRRGADVYRRDHGCHASPNAGHPEAAMAGALGVRLGGASTYGGDAHAAPVLGGEYRLPGPHDVRRAMRLTVAVSLLATGLAVAIATLRRTR